MITSPCEGNAIVYCEGAFDTPNGKTAHGLVRFTRRYRTLCIIDSRYAGKDAGEVLDRTDRGIPILSTVDEAVSSTSANGQSPTYLVVGLAPDGGRLNAIARRDIRRAVELGLNIDSGLHDYVSDDPEIVRLARQMKLKIRDIRRSPRRNELHFFSGKIEEVASLKVAVLGTDSAVGKRTTAWLLVEELEKRGYRSEMIGTGQTSWMQGAGYCIILDAIINDFVSGEIEHVVWKAWKDNNPDVIVIEGQGSLMNPAYPGGFEILAAARPDVVLLQHAPARRDYDGFPGYRIHPLDQQIKAVELISGKPVVGIALNHEGLSFDQIGDVCHKIRDQVGIPAFDILLDGPGGLVETLLPFMEN